MAFKELHTTINDFSRWFRKQAVDLASKSSLSKVQKDFIEVKLPEVIYTKITEAEQIHGMSGAQKMARVTTLVKEVLSSQQLAVIMPLVKLWLERAVMFIYRKYFIEQFDKLGLSDLLETMLGRDLDSDGDIGGKPVPGKLPESKLFGTTGVETHAEPIEQP